MRIIQLIRDTEAARGCRFTFELLPPLKGEDTSGVFGAIDTLMPYGPAYINVTCHREETVETTGADGRPVRRVVRRRPGTVGISAAIRARYGVEVVPHLICAGLSRYDLEDALIDLDFLGLENVLALQGDKLRHETAFVPHPGGHPHAAGLVAQIAAMNRGRFIDGEGHRTRFCVGVAGYPEGHPRSADPQAEILRLKEKVEAGADYVVTQMCFDNRRLFAFADACRAAGIEVPIVPGIKPLSNVRQLDVLPGIFGVSIPAELRRELRACRTPESMRDAGADWAAAQAAELRRAGFPVIHFYTMGRTDNVARIVEKVF